MWGGGVFHSFKVGVKEVENQVNSGSGERGEGWSSRARGIRTVIVGGEWVVSIIGLEC